jgi:hypothetical protein
MAPTAPVKLMRVHRFITSQQAGEMFDTLLCSDSEFIVRPNEEHMLLTDMGAVMAVIEAQQLQLDAGQPCLQLCYSIGLKGQDMKLTVDRATPLSLLLSMDCLPLSVLLNLGCFHVEHVEWRGQLGEPWSGPLLPH